MKLSLLVFALSIFAAGAYADAPKKFARQEKLPASARVFVLDKDAPPTDKTESLPRLRPALKTKL